MANDDQLLVQAQQLLEDGFQKCLDLTKKLRGKLQDKVQQRVGPRLVSKQELHDEFKGISRELYEVMAETLFRLIRTVQQEDCEKTDQINFYFWPGYHSVLIDRRIFVDHDDAHFGIGICGDPEAKKIEVYYDSTQARLFHYLIKPKNTSPIAPVDFHTLWLKRAEATDKKSAFPFLVVTNRPIPTGATQPPYFELTCSSHKSELWGKCLDDFVQQDEVLGQLIDKQRKDREMGDGNFSIQAENKLQSLWLHSAFCDFEPPWLSAFIEELRTCPEASGLSSSLEEALTDDRATNWGDHSTHRPLFTTWVNLSLSAWLDPRNIAMDVDEQPRRSKRNLASKTVGSAAFLSSMPLRPRYFALAKSWISEVYNAVRNAEIAMLLHNRELRISEANLAGPYFAHEIQTVVDQALATAQRDFANNSEEAVERRRFVLYSIRTLCILAYSFTKVISVDGRMTEEAEETLLRPLQDLRNDKVLISDVINIAEKIYQSVRSKQGGTITFPETPSSKIFANELQHGACFLLTVELLRNYCQSKASGPPATFRAWLENDENILNIELEGSTGAGRNPRSMSLARLDQFLRVLGFGKTTFDWDNKAHTFKATVQVDLGIKSLHRHQFS